MSHVKLIVAEHTEDWLVMEGTGKGSRGVVLGRYNCATGILRVKYDGTYRSVRHIIDKMEKFLQMKGYPLKRTRYV